MADILFLDRYLREVFMPDAEDEIVNLLKEIKELGYEKGRNIELENLKTKIGDLKAKIEGYRNEHKNIYIYDVDLSEIKLTDVNFSHTEIRNVTFEKAELINCNFDSASFQGGTSLIGAILTNSSFRNASFESTIKIKPSDFTHTELDGAMFVNTSDKTDPANPKYIKMIYRACGRYRDAGKQYSKEMRAAQKQAYKNKRWGQYLLFSASRWLFGYGEHPWKVLLWALVVIALYSGLYYSVFPGQIYYNNSSNIDDMSIKIKFTLPRSLYFSTVTFATLGYGDWHPRPECTSAQLLASSEALIGLVLGSIFTVSLARILIRD
jgi:hypothetical protein